MDWLIYIMMIILFAAVLVLLWKNYRIKKEAKLFAEKVEDALDAIVTGKEWNMEEELEDSLWGRTGTQLVKAGNVFRKKEEDGFREKERVKGLISDISHQIRTPIANIKLYLELLEDEEFSQSGQEFLGKIKGQMEKIDFLRSAFPILEKGLPRRGRQRSLQDFTVSRRFMINQGLGSDYILQEQSWNFRRAT